AECGWQIGGFYAKTRGQKLAVAGKIPDELHTAAAPVLENDKRALAGFLQLQHQGPGIERPKERPPNAPQIVPVPRFYQPQEAAQTLSVAVDISFHECPLLGPQTSSSYTGAAPTGRLRTQIEHCARRLDLNGSGNYA